MPKIQGGKSVKEESNSALCIFVNSELITTNTKVVKHTIIYLSYFSYQINAVDRCSGFYRLYWFHGVDGHKQIA